MNAILPTVIIVYDAGAAGPIDICRAAEGICRPVFAFQSDSSTLSPETADLLKALAPSAPIDINAAAPFDELARHDPAAVVTFSEPLLRLTSEIAQFFGLRFHSPETITRLTDKKAQRTALAAAGIATPRFARVENPRDAIPALRRVGIPAVVKPIQGSGSRDTYRIVDEEEGASLICRILRRLEQCPLIVEEEWIGDPLCTGPQWGDYVSVETIFSDGRCTHMAITGKLPLAEPFRETGYFLPSTLHGTAARQVIELAERAAAAVGVLDGFTHTEVKLTAQGPRVIEVNGRLGAFVAWLLRRSSDVDAPRLAIQAALGRMPDVFDVKPRRVAFQRTLLPPRDATHLESIVGVDELSMEPAVEAIHIWAKPGTPVDWTSGYYGSLGVIYGSAADHSELGEVLDRVGHILKLSYATA